MKKTLVALAVLAASGATFAQATISGALNYGWRASSSPAGDASGFGIRDASVTFASTEDMGGGMKVDAQLKLDGGGLGRGAVTGGDAFVKLSNGSGYLKAGTWEADFDLNEISSNVVDLYLDGLVGGGYAAPGAGSTGAYNNSDMVHDTVELGTTFGAVTVSFAHYEPSTATYGGGQGIGTGAGGQSFQRQNLFKAVYAAGALTAEASYGTFDNKNSTAVLWASQDNVATLAGNFDFGVAKLGAGYQKTAYSNGSAAETALQALVPIGAFSIGAAFDRVTLDSNNLAPAVDGTINGTGLVASYTLSKQTSLRAQYMSYDATTNPTQKSTRSELLLKHSF
jgi:hypothetical protein